MKKQKAQSLDDISRVLGYFPLLRYILGFTSDSLRKIRYERQQQEEEALYYHEHWYERCQVDYEAWCESCRGG